MILLNGHLSTQFIISFQICLVPRNEDTVLVMSYEEMKQCFERSFGELSEAAAYVTEDSVDKGQAPQDL